MVGGLRPRRDPPGDQPPDADDPHHVRRRAACCRRGPSATCGRSRMLDKGWRPAGNSLMELLTHVFDLVRIYAGDPAWVSAHLTVAAEPAPAATSGPAAPATLREDIVYSQTAWPRDRDCGLVLGDRCAATFGFGPREGWHRGLTATVDSFFQPRTARLRRGLGAQRGAAGHGGVALPGRHEQRTWTSTCTAAPGRPRDAWSGSSCPAPPSPPGRTPGAARRPRTTRPWWRSWWRRSRQGREHRSSGREGRWALEMIMGVYEFHRRGGARVPLPLERPRPPPAALDRRGRGAPAGQARAPGEGTDAGAGRAGVGDAPPAPRASLASHARQLTAAAPRRGLTGRTLAPSPLRVTRARRASGPGGRAGRAFLADSWRRRPGRGATGGRDWQV